MRLRFYLALGLALAVLVTGGGSPAHALVKPPAINGERLLGGVVQTGKGMGRFTKVVPGPVGAILTVGSLAWWAYNEYDAKIHAPQPGGDAEAWLGAPAPAYPTSLNDGIITAQVTSVSGRSVSMEVNCANWVYYSGPQSPPQPWTTYSCGAGVGAGGNVAVGAASGVLVKEVECHPATGANVIRALSASWARGAYSTGGPGTAQTITNTLCNSGETVVGFRLGPHTVTPPIESSTRYQTAPIGWGTLSSAPTTYPEGDLVFQTAVIDVTCRNAATNATQHITVTSEWGTGETLDLPSCKQRLGGDWYGVGVKVIPMDPEIDDVPLDPEVWPDWDVPDFMPEEWTEDELTPEEEADPCHTSSKGCGLTISIDGEPVFPGTTTRTKIDTVRGQDPDRVTCKWGSREVEWKWCIPLLPTFEPGSGGATTTDPTKPETEVGNPPTTGTGTQPVPTEGANCIKGAFSWNPVDWVFVPVKCALQWAFKPTTAFQTRIARVKTAFESKPPFSWLVSLGSLPSVSGGGCPTNWNFEYKGESYPILCGTAMGNGLHAFRPTMVVLLVGAAVYPFLRALVYAAFPIIKPVPHD